MPETIGLTICLGIIVRSFSYENIIRKSNIEDGQFTTFKLKRETLDMLDAIARGSEKNVSKSTIIHNLVSTFLNENIERLKMVASKKIKKDFSSRRL